MPGRWDTVLEAFRHQVWSWLDRQLQPATQERYSNARGAFDSWCAAAGFDWRDLQPSEVDVLASRFVLQVKEDRDVDLSRQGCLDLMASVQTRLGCSLRLTQRVLRAWQKEQPPKQAEAMPSVVAFALATVMIQVLGEPEAALHAVLAFCGLLRIGESLSLSYGDVMLPRDESPRAVVLILRATKRSFDQRVVLANADVVAMVEGFAKFRGRVPNSEPIAPLTYARFARILAKAVRLLRLPGTSWRSHSLRRGGATALMEAGWSFEAVKLYGRWASDTSAREYIRLGQTALSRMNHSVPVEQWRLYNLLASACVGAFQGLAAGDWSGR